MMEDTRGTPDIEIAKDKFEILCDMELEYDYCQVANFEGMHDESGYTGRVPFSVNYDDDPPSLEDEGEIEISGSGGGQLFPITLPSIDLEFPLEDGHKIEWDFDMLVATGESSVTLHVP